MAFYSAGLVTTLLLAGVLSKFSHVRLVSKVFPLDEEEHPDPDRSGITPDSIDPRQHIQGGIATGLRSIDSRRADPNSNDPRDYINRL